MLPQLRNSLANPAVADAPRTATPSPGAPDATKPPDPYREDLERTIRLFEGAGIAVFPARRRTKGTYVPGWPEMTVAGALSLTRAELDRGRINLAGRTGDGWAAIDLDDKNGAEPEDMLALLLRQLGSAVLAVVRTQRGFHIWVRVREAAGNGYCSFIGGEIFSGPHLAMLPPSVHPEGREYAWVIEPHDTDAVADLRAFGLVPDLRDPRPSGAGRDAGRPRRPQPATPDVREEFVRLMAAAGVSGEGSQAQTLTLCPWHHDRLPSLSVNWEAAVFYCFSVHCGARGGIGSLRRRVRGDTPSYRQWGNGAGDNHQRNACDGRDDSSGDNLGCADVDAATERLASGLEHLGLHQRCRSVRDCRHYFRVGKCSQCARTPAYPISCGDPLCLRCMPGRLAADWERHRASLPEKLTLLRLRPRDLWGIPSDVLKKVRSRFRQRRGRSDIAAGVYGARLDRDFGVAILLAIPADLPIPESSRAFEVEVVALNQGPRDFLRWLQGEYVQEAQGWETPDELAVLIEETKGRRRFQGFGGVYGEVEEGSDVEEKTDMVTPTEAKVTECRKPLSRISGGSLKGKHAKGEHACPFCGGAVELYPFSVPADQVEQVGGHWLWRGQRPAARAAAPL
jgi:hypothetical protein